MKKIVFISLLLCSFLFSKGSHIVGGELFYTYMGDGMQPNTSRYEVTLRLFTVCDACGGSSPIPCAPSFVVVGIFNDAYPFDRVVDLTLPLVSDPKLNLSTYPDCIDIRPPVCYRVNTYTQSVDLDRNLAGYRFAFQTCCRVDLVNVIGDKINPHGGSTVTGVTYEAVLLGADLNPDNKNTLAVVNLKDTALICYNSQFSLNFNAVDPDNDSLSYELLPAYTGTLKNDFFDPPDPPLYDTLYYSMGYSGVLPLGDAVKIDPKSGEITGTAPADEGHYVVNVVIKEWRNATVIGQHNKDFIITVNRCSFPKLEVQPRYLNCNDYTIHFENTGNDINIQTYDWDFGDGNHSSLAAPTYTYKAAGDYTVKLTVNRGIKCEDFATSYVSIYPGLHAAVKIDGQCQDTVIKFTDLSAGGASTINSWAWDFGDAGSTQNTSFAQNPTHAYTASGNYVVSMQIATDKGCKAILDTTVFAAPAAKLIEVTKDTLICSIDTLQLNATGSGTVLWTPNYNINNPAIPNPLVSPDVTTVYHVKLTNAGGCTDTASVTINVVDHVVLSGLADTSICLGDALVLKEISNGGHFVWTPNDGSINNTTLLKPTVKPLTATTYHLVASAGSCTAQDDIKVSPFPYPVANAGADKTICSGYSTQLHAGGGAYYSWSPVLFLNNAKIPDPQVLNPASSVRYVVTVRDTLGCPKGVTDTVIVTVIKLKAGAGPADTSVVLGQPLQLNATGGTNYTWLPDNRWLSSISIPDPVALPQNNIVYTVRVSDNNGCIDYASIKVLLYNLAAGFYPPNAFTPNGDGVNDFFQPKKLGLKSLDLFRIYNRLGQMVFTTSNMQQDWDGTFNGKAQDPGTYIWYGEGTDYTGKKVQKKGTVILLR